MRRVLSALLGGLLCVSFPVSAQDPGFQVVVDFDDLPPGPLPPGGTFITKTVAGLGDLTIQLSRGPDRLSIDAVGVPGWGSRSLSTFNPDPAQPNGTPVEMRIIAVPPGLGVESIAFQMGDFVPSDIDDLWTSTIAGFGAQVAGTVAVTADLFDQPAPLPNFSRTTVLRKRAMGIEVLHVLGGSWNFPGSVYYDNFTFTLKPTANGQPFGFFAAGTDVPESDFGGDPRNDQLATDSGQGGAVGVVYGCDSGSDSLYTVDLATGATTIIGRLGGADTDRFTTPIAMAVRPGDGTIFVWNNSGGPENPGGTADRGLATVDPDTGLATLVGSSELIQGAIAVDGEGVLYGQNGGNGGPLAIISFDDGVAFFDNVGEEPPFILRLFGLDYNPADGHLYGVAAFEGILVLKIDPGTGEVAEQFGLTGPPLTVNIPGTLLFDANGTLHGTTIGGEIFEISLAPGSKGAVSNVRSISPSPQGLGRTAAGGTPPEPLPLPPTITLLLNGAAFNPPGGVAWVNGKTLSLLVTASDPNAGDAITLAGTLNGVPIGGSNPGPTLSMQVGTNPAERQFSWTPEGAAGPQNLNFTAASGGDVANIGLTLVLPGEGEGGDTDGDGLLDSWETDGYDFETEGGEIIHVDLPGLGADPNVKDVFVVLDYMVGSAPNADGVLMAFDHRPKDIAMQLIRDAFSPPPGDPRAGKHEDITVHVLVGHQLDAGGNVIPGPDGKPLPRIPFVEQLGELSGGNYVWTAPPGATNTYFDDLKEANFPPEFRQAMYYGIFAHKIGGTYSGMARGAPESDFIVSLGDILDFRSRGLAPGSMLMPRDIEQAGTCMHEKGHCLGLRHGGGTSELNKPNYLSVMNLPFQLSGLRYDGVDGLLDYSFVQLDSLNEAQLNEAVGLTGPAGTDISRYGTTWFFRPGQIDPGLVQRWTSAASGPVNWRVDSLSSPPSPDTISSNVAVDLNKSGTQTVLAGHDDWDNLNFLGGVKGTGVPLPRPPTSPAAEVTLELANSFQPAGLGELHVHHAAKKNVLTWKPVGKKSDGITYNVYRSTNGGPLVLLGNTDNSNFQDTAIDTADTHLYNVTVLNALGVESAGPEKIIETPKKK